HWYRHDITDGYVDEFYIAPEARRDGAGRIVGEAMLTEFRRRNVREIHLHVLLRNTRAAGFWQSLGFTPAMYSMTLPL
ncbi:MAG: GNAT family N-acetyltransferase, partial [Dehalococcoidia bacterium]